MTVGAPTFWLVAGANGVGKTTYAMRHIRTVSGSVHFVNLDEIARGLSPLDPDIARQDAARLALGRARQLIAAGQSFTMESTLAGRTQLRLAERARAARFRIHLLYFFVADADECLRRIRRRVAEGGHDVPEAEVRRRWTRSLANFPLYAARADLWRVFDNRGPSRIVAEGDGRVEILDAAALEGGPASLAAAIKSMASNRGPLSP